MIVFSKDKKELQQKFEYCVILDGVNGTVKKIFDDNIIDSNIGDLRGKAELLLNGTVKQEINFVTYFTFIDVGDIIEISAPKYRVPKELDKNRFIVESVKSDFQGAKALNSIKAVRYD